MKRILAFALASATSVLAGEWDAALKPFLEVHCYDCHGDGAKKGGLAMDELSDELEDPAVFVKWERIYDRALNAAEVSQLHTLELPPLPVIHNHPQNVDDLLLGLQRLEAVVQATVFSFMLHLLLNQNLHRRYNYLHYLNFLHLPHSMFSYLQFYQFY